MPFDDKGYITENPILPPTHGDGHRRRLASLIVFGLLFKFAVADRSRRASTTAPRDPEANSTIRPRPRSTAEAEAADIRQAKGDIDAERARLLAEADAQAAALSTTVGPASTPRSPSSKLAPTPTSPPPPGASTDELRAEIARLSGVAVDHVVNESLDDATQQELIEDFIQRVGASTGASA